MFSEQLLEKIRAYKSRADVWGNCLEIIQQFRDRVAEMGWQERPKISATETLRQEIAASSREEILLLAASLIAQLREHEHEQDADAMQHWVDDYVRTADLTNRGERDLVQDVLVGLAGRYGAIKVT